MIRFVVMEPVTPGWRQDPDDQYPRQPEQRDGDYRAQKPARDGPGEDGDQGEKP